MINILLTSMFLHTLLIYLLKLKQTSLNCGLFGGSFNKPIDDIIREKLKIIGFFNMTRGKDSCGYYNGNIIVKGVDKTKEFYDLVVQRGIDKNDNGNDVFIGHTRQSTYGANTLANAHPFNIDESLILAHNGTISNIWSLCTEHNVPSAAIFVDSLALGKILNKDGYKVLEEYKGGAALLMHRVKEPGSLYVYHGGSYNYNTDTFVEERPLFWLQTEEGIYLSSLKNALDFIKNDDDAEATEVPHNQIWKIRRGVKCKKPSFTINRSIGDTEKWVSPVVTKSLAVYPIKNAYNQADIFRDKQLLNKTINSNYYVSKAVDDEPMGLKISDELDPAHGEGCIYFSRGRFRKDYVIKADGKVIIEAKTGKILNSMSEGFRPKELYFCKGILIKDLKSWLKIVKAMEFKNDVLYKALSLERTINFAKELSYYSKYPITNYQYEEALNVSSSERELFYLNGKVVVANSFTPIYSERNYHFKNGKLIKIYSKGEKAIPYAMTKIDTTIMTPEKALEEINNEKTFDPEVLQIVGRFNLTEDSVKNLKETIGEYGLEALESYCSDVLCSVLDEVYDKVSVNTLVEELLEDSVTRKIPISKLLDNPTDLMLEDYVNDIMVDIIYNKKDKEDESDDKDIEDAEDQYNTYNLTDDDNFHEKHDLNSKLLSNEQAAELLERYNLKQNKRYNERYNEGGFSETCDAPLPKRMFKDDDTFTSFEIVKPNNDEKNTEQIEEADEEAVLLAPKVTRVLKELESISSEFSSLSFSDLAQNVSKKLETAIESIRYEVAQEFRANNKSSAALKIDNIIY